MNERYEMNNDNLEIDLPDMVFYLLKRWRSLLVFLIAGAALTGLVYAMRHSSMVSVSSQDEQKDNIETYVVDDESRRDMELAFEYRRLYEEEMEYIRNSVFMQLDPNDIARGKVSWYISAGEDTCRICTKFMDIINSSDMLDEMKLVMQNKYDAKYIKEMLCVSTGGAMRSYDSGNEESAQILFGGGTGDSAVITYVLSCFDVETCEEMLRVLNKYVESLDETCRGVYDLYISEKTGSSVGLTADGAYLGLRDQYLERARLHRTYFTSLETGFSNEDSAYYRASYLKSGYDENEGSVVSDTFDKTKMFKWSALGMILFGVLWCVCLSCVYLLSHRIKTAKEITAGYGVPVLGNVQTDVIELKGIDRWIDKLQKYCSRPFEKKEYIEDMIAGRAENNIMLCGNLGDNIIAAYMAGFGENCKNLSKSIYIHMDQKALALAKKADGIILLIYIGRTTQYELCRELEICRLEGISVTGAIAVV